MASPKDLRSGNLPGTGTPGWDQTPVSQGTHYGKHLETWKERELPQVFGKIRRVDLLERCGKRAFKRYSRRMRLPQLIYFLDVGINSIMRV